MAKHSCVQPPRRIGLGWLRWERPSAATQRQVRRRLAADDHLAVGVHHLQDQASEAVEQAASRAESLMHEGTQALRQGSKLLRDSARSASHQTQDYIQREPLKAVLIAAASGAALVALWSLVARSGPRR